MWQYQNTDELYHANMYKNMNKKSNHELYHSDIYLGKDFSDGIKHWKYIKRIKMANGKWRYVYRDEKGEALDKQYKDAVNRMNNSKSPVDRAIATGDYYKYGLKRSKHRILSAPRRSVEKGIGKAANALSDFNDKHKIITTTRTSKILDGKNPVSLHPTRDKIKKRIGLAINKIKSRKTKGKA